MAHDSLSFEQRVENFVEECEEKIGEAYGFYVYADLPVYDYDFIIAVLRRLSAERIQVHTEFVMDNEEEDIERVQLRMSRVSHAKEWTGVYALKDTPIAHGDSMENIACRQLTAMREELAGDKQIVSPTISVTSDDQEWYRLIKTRAHAFGLRAWHDVDRDTNDCKFFQLELLERSFGGSDLKLPAPMSAASSSSSSSSEIKAEPISLDDESDEKKNTKNQKVFTFDGISSAVLAEFNQLPHRILVGRNKLSFPVSYPHLLHNSKMWQKAMEGEGRPDHILQEFNIAENDTDFLAAWLRVNGFYDGAELKGQGQMYLDYFDCIQGETEIQRQLRKAIQEVKTERKKRKSFLNGEAAALELVRKYHAFLKTAKQETWVYDTFEAIYSSTLQHLEALGFLVTETNTIGTSRHRYHIEFVADQARDVQPRAKKRPRLTE